MLKSQPAATDKTSRSGRLLTSLLGTILKLRYLNLLVVVVAFVISAWWMQNRMGQELFPSVDAGQITIYARLPSGTRIEVTEQRISQVEATIIELIGEPDPDPSQEKHADSDLRLLISNIGVLMDWPAAYTPNSGPMDSFLLVQLKGRQPVFDHVQQLRTILNDRFPDVEFAFDTGGMLTAALNMGEPSPIHFQIQGSQLENAQKVAGIIKDLARQVPGTVDVRIAQRIDYPVLEVEMDRELAARQGITPDDVMKNLVAATNSTINFEPTFWIDKNKGNHYFFGVQYWEKDLSSEQTSEQTLLNIPVGGDWNNPRRLGNVAKITRTTGPAVINHRNITRVTDVYANVLPGHDIGSVVASIESLLEQDTRLGVVAAVDGRGSYYELGHPDWKGMSFRMMGEVRTMRDSFRQFAGGLLIAAILVYLVMVAQFNNFIDPLIIVLTVPLGFIGVVVMLTATGTNLSIMAFMGIIMTVGIVVEYSIVLVDFANRRMEEGLPVREAIIDATRVRLRPILMTSMTTWLALLPMAIGFGGGEANAPLARAIIGGVLGATLLSLIIVPSLYLILKRDQKRPALETGNSAGESPSPPDHEPTEEREP
jgi:multidrug efflux pump subunit AcrB